MFATFVQSSSSSSQAIAAPHPISLPAGARAMTYLRGQALRGGAGIFPTPRRGEGARRAGEGRGNHHNK
jgi:hypothetical protein